MKLLKHLITIFKAKVARKRLVTIMEDYIEKLLYENKELCKKCDRIVEELADLDSAYQKLKQDYDDLINDVLFSEGDVKDEIIEDTPTPNNINIQQEIFATNKISLIAQGIQDHSICSIEGEIKDIEQFKLLEFILVFDCFELFPSKDVDISVSMKRFRCRMKDTRKNRQALDYFKAEKDFEWATFSSLIPEESEDEEE